MINLGPKQFETIQLNGHDVTIYLGSKQIWTSAKPYQFAPNSTTYSLAWADGTGDLSVNATATTLTYTGYGRGSTGWGRSYLYYTGQIPTYKCQHLQFTCTRAKGYSAGLYVYPPNVGKPTTSSAVIAGTGLSKNTTYTLEIPKQSNGKPYEYVVIGLFAQAYGADPEYDERGATLTDIYFKK